MNRLQSLYDAANKECMNDQHQFDYHYEMSKETFDRLFSSSTEEWEEQKASGFKYKVYAFISYYQYREGYSMGEDDIIGKLNFTSTEYNKTIAIIVRLKLNLPLGKAVLRKTPIKANKGK